MTPLILLASIGSVDILGFSSDGRLAGVVASEAQDRTGVPSARAFLIEVDKGEALEVAHVTLAAPDANEQAASDAAKVQLLQAAKTLGVETFLPAEDADTKRLGNLLLREKRSKGTCVAPFRPLLLSLALNQQTLSSEAKLPGHRPCATQCRLSRLVVRGTAVLGLVSCHVPTSSLSWTVLSLRLAAPLDAADNGVTEPASAFEPSDLDTLPDGEARAAAATFAAAVDGNDSGVLSALLSDSGVTLKGKRLDNAKLAAQIEKSSVRQALGLNSDGGWQTHRPLTTQKRFAVFRGSGYGKTQVAIFIKLDGAWELDEIRKIDLGAP